jgi:hypothetical protein
VSSDQTVPTEGLIAGRYRLVRRIAEGGMGQVYLAIDERLSRRVAVKVLPATAADDPDLVSRFRREAQLAAGLSHANVVAVYDFVEDDGPLCLVMEYVEGETLRRRLDRTGALTVRESVRILTGVLRGLAAAHREGLIHRDVKPENVLLGQDGSIKVTDFGLAREASTLSRTDFGQVLGTIHYLAPEQLRGRRADERSDVYAVGLVLVDLLTGRRAMQGETHAQVAAMHANGSVPLASERVSTVPLEMDRLVARATALDPADRPGSAGEFLTELREATRLLSDTELDAEPVYIAGMEPQRPASPGARTATMPEPDAGPMATTVLPSLAARCSPVARGAGGGMTPRAPVRSAIVPTAGSSRGGRCREGARCVDLRADQTQAYQRDRTQAARSWTARPPAAAQVRKHSSVTLVVSQGPERYAVPKLVDAKQADVERLLNRTHLALGTVTEEFSETVAARHVVISQDPARHLGQTRHPGRDRRQQGSRADPRRPTSSARPPTRPEALKAARVQGDGGRSGQQRDRALRGRRQSDPSGFGHALQGRHRDHRALQGPGARPVPGCHAAQEGRRREDLEAAGFKVKINKLFGGASRPCASRIRPPARWCAAARPSP